jgi:hypothetical protein
MQKQNDEIRKDVYKDNSLIKCFGTIYLVSTFVAFLLIIPNESHWYLGIAKSLV